MININQYNFLQVLPKSSWTIFKTIFETLSALEACHVTIIGGVVYEKSIIFEVFENISVNFQSLFVRSFLLVGSDRVLVINTKSFIMGALATLETRLKVPILAIF